MVYQVYQDQWEWMDFQDFLGRRGRRERKVSEFRVFKVHLGQKEKRVIQDYKAQREKQESKESRESQALGGKRVLKGIKETRVKVGKVDLSGLQELQASLELLDERVTRGSAGNLVTLLKGYSVLQGKRVPGGMLDKLGHQDHKESKEIKVIKVKRVVLDLESPVSLVPKERVEKEVMLDYQGNLGLKAAMGPKERKGRWASQAILVLQD